MVCTQKAVEKLHDLQENLRIAETLVVTWKTWGDPKFVAGEIAKQKVIISKAEKEIARVTQLHIEAGKRMLEAEATKRRVQAELKRFKNRKNISKLLKLVDDLKRLQRAMEEEQKLEQEQSD